jgi:hypothetical protein
MSVESSESPQPTPVKKGTGCGLLAWVVILAIGLAVAVLLIHEAKVEQERQKAAKDKRLEVRSTQLAAVGTDVLKAADLIQQGDIARGLDVLQSQQTILGSLVTEAQSSGDTSDATDIVARREALSGVVAAIKQKQEETRQFAADQVSLLEKQFPGVAKKAQAAQEAKPGETPAAPGETSALTEPAKPGAEAPAATPATPAPAPTPATPAPAEAPKSPGGP